MAHRRAMLTPFGRLLLVQGVRESSNPNALEIGTSAYALACKPFDRAPATARSLGEPKAGGNSQR
jgi:hypothetical protein